MNFSNFSNGKNPVMGMMSLWTDLPGKLSEQWMKLYNNFSPPSLSLGLFKKSENTKKLPFGSLGMYEEWMKMSGETFRRVLEMAPGGSVGPETYNKVFDGMKAYFSIYEFWTSWTKVMAPFEGKTPSSDQWNGAQEKLTDEYKRVLDTVIGVKPPDTMEGIMKLQGKMMSQGIEFLSWFKTPWKVAAKQGPQVASKVLTGDITAVREGFSLWQTAVSDTIGKLLNIPSIGYSREHEERQKVLAEAYVKYATSFPSFYSEFYQTGSKAFDNLLEKSRDIPADHSPESFKKFYSLWIRVNEDAFYDLFKRSEFSDMMNEVMKKGLDFKKKLDKNTSKHLESLSIPNRDEMNDVYKAFHDIKYEIRQLSREVREMKENLPE